MSRFWSEILTTDEMEYTQCAIDALGSIDWARPLLKRVKSEGGLIPKNMPWLFEVRFAHELSLAGASAVYEHSAGVGKSTVDFRIHGNPEWFVELVSLRESAALKAATHQSGECYERVLTTNAEDRRQSDEGEMIKAQERICEKVFKDGKPTKFPMPTSNTIHAVLVDMRGYLGYGGDRTDYQQIANGPDAVPSDPGWTNPYRPDPSRNILYWGGDPIRGIFENASNHPLNGSHLMRERIHFLGFIAEHQFRYGEIRSKTYFQANPHLLPTSDNRESTYSTYMLSEARS